MSEIELRDAILRHALQLQRLSAGEQIEAEAILRELERELRALLASESLSAADKRTIRKLISQAEEIINPAYARLASTVDTHGLALIVAEKTVAALEDVFPAAIGSPTTERLASLTKNVLIEGSPLSEWWKAQATNLKRDFAAQVRQGVIAGETNERIVRRIVDGRSEPGIMHVARRHARTLVHSSIMSAANEARLATFRKNSRLIAGVRWLATLDSHTCRQCAALDGMAWDLEAKPLKGTTVSFLLPPAHANCFPGDTLVSSRDRITGVSKRRFNGEVVVIKTAAGRELTCTPNHPILTDRGWVAAGLLNVGSNVVADLSSERPRAIDGDGQQVPARIHDVAESFLASLEMVPVPVEVSAEDFHGDGRGSDVAIVWSDRLLESEFYSLCLKHHRELLLVAGARAGLITLSGEGEPTALLEGALAASRGSVRSSHLGLSFGGAHSAPLEPLSLGLASTANAALAQYSSDHDALQIELLGDSVFGRAADIGAADSILIDDRAGPDWYAAMLQFAQDDGMSNAGLTADLSGIQPAEVELDTVVECRRVGFSHNVYNLETEGGYYTAGGLIVHNCRCVASPIPKSFRDLGFDVDEPGEGTRASSEGPIAAKTTFADFLKRQPASFVERTLGKRRAELFLKGRLGLRDLISGSGRELTLEELGIEP